MVMCTFWGLTSDKLASPAPNARVLALNDRDREILLKARQSGYFPNIGKHIDHPRNRPVTATPLNDYRNTPNEK